jgi:ATP-dependent Clp protease ATP-binding subunit ClpC
MTLQEDLEQVLEPLRSLPRRWRRAEALLASEPFQQAVALLEPVADLEPYVGSGDRLVMRVALEALARREPDEETGLLLLDVQPGPQTAIFLLRALDRHVKSGLVSALLTRASPVWVKAPLADLKALIERRDEDIRIGDVPPERLSALAQLADALAGVLPPAVVSEARARYAAQMAIDRLKPIGRTWFGQEARALADGVVSDDAFARDLRALEAAVTATPARPVLVIGELGTGRTTRLRALGARLAERGWGVFEAGAAEVNAGQTYIGELEGRVRELAGTLGGNRVLWIVPDFEQFLWTGTHRHSRTGLLDLVLATLEGARIHLAGEIDPAAYERLVRARPAVRTAFEPLRIAPASEKATLALAKGDPAVVREALALARQYLPGALPGALLSLLEATRNRVAGEPGIADVLATVAERSGMPLRMLDERERIDVGELREFFAKRVIGQPEAVECVVERVALIKAGLTDPTRPQAVLLFVGPTGTGKTEIAKALAEFLFGSPDRLIRLDCSEYQTPYSARRVLGEGEPEDPSLVGRIRRQPFSVVLLDEVEKADPGVWDLFLQVFDDGRLSDPRGEAADFRHAVIIMTSNLGAKVATGGVGFNPVTGFAEGSVTKAVTRAFRPEFLNRIDRTVVFRPLSRPVMRDILAAELEAVLARRGLRGRDWAVEWDDSALEFLLAAGFTPDLGARPLKRAVERHFLTPLALAIASHDYPGGDQFLFVTAGAGGLDVTFVDPDAPEPEAPAGAPASLRTLAREGGAGRAELAAAYAAVRERVGDPEWQGRKAELLARMGDPGFWDDEGRLPVLSEVELRDRIEAGLRGAGSLLGRLSGSRPPATLVRRAAQRLLLLDAALDALDAGEPSDAVLRVEASAAGAEFAARVAGMYRGWARERGMTFEVESESARPFKLRAAVGGFAALQILRPEAGLHVLEQPDGKGGFTRRRVRVIVEPEDGAPRARIVRRYRERPTPLVRDAVRGWRTGRLDLVLSGGFDLIE